MSPRLAVVTDLPTPYRTPVFDAVAARGRLEIHVLYLSRTEEGRQAWSVDPSGHPHSFVPGRKVVLRRRAGPFTWKWNAGLGRVLDSVDPDVVLVGGWAHPAMHRAASWARRRRRPYLVTSETHPRAQSFVKRHAKAMLAGPLVARASGWLPVSSRARELLVSLGADPARCTTVPNSPDAERFAAARRDDATRRETRRSLGASGAPATSFVGRLVPAKGLDVLLRAAASVTPRPTLWIAGGGPLDRDLRRLAGSLGLESTVRFLGDADYAGVVSLLAAADVVALPSVHEPYGVALHEGMAAGCAGLATDAVGAAFDLIEDGVSGRRVPAGDPAALARAWSEMLADPGRLAAMGAAASMSARARGRDFAVENLESAALAALSVAAGAGRA